MNVKLIKILESIYNRSEMPQVSGDDLPSAIRVLQANNVPVSMVELIPTQIKNSQKEINKGKVKNIINDMKMGEKMPPCIISKDRWMVDGHHRNIAYRVVEPDQLQKYIQIQLPRDQAIEIYKKIEGIL